MLKLHKYPRTPHLEGSRLQPGDEDLAQVPFAALRGRLIAVTEKVDGANAGLRFDAAGRPWLQSRGHFLTGGVREKHFNLFKQWAGAHADVLYDRLGTRYALYGEWLYAKHTIFYDTLPHYFLAFDILDLETGECLSHDQRVPILQGLPVAGAPVLYQGPATTLDGLLALLGPSRFKGPQWRQRLAASAAERGLDLARVVAETDPTDLMEGLYIKVEDDGRVVERYKFVRASFLTVVEDSGTHWLRRPILPNLLGEGVSLFGAAP